MKNSATKIKNIYRTHKKISKKITILELKNEIFEDFSIFLNTLQNFSVFLQRTKNISGMIIRRKIKLDPQDAEITFTLSFTISDVTTWLREYVELDLKGMTHNEMREKLKDYEQPHDWITQFFLRNPRIIGWMSTNRAMQVSEWAIIQALKSGWLIYTEKEGEHGRLYRFNPEIVSAHVYEIACDHK